jgi:Protein of unknown function (DUF3489)
VLLSAASQRVDHYLTPPSGARLASAKKAAAKLLKGGLVREVRARKDAPIWRRDEDADQGFALKLTAAGLKAIAADLDAGDDEAARQTQGDEAIKPETTAGGIDVTDAGPRLESSGHSYSRRVPRAGTKIGIVIEMLERDVGATIDELVAATGWLPHTTRAVLTGLRKRGFEIDRRRAKDQSASAYLIAERNNAAHV